MAAPQDRETVTQGNSLTPERFARVRVVFEAALERPAADRRGFVDGACGGDEDLRREVERMLAADGRVDRVLDGAPSSSSSAPEEGRFPAGTVLAGRYRILGLIGKGGMGEVYKAFDLILNQTVALKFLAPAHYGEAALARFRNEVRIARQVAHPNVCRVYDLGMVEGLHFLSMEYIDGEDLASLLRRIGRLPQDKAIEFTRKICAGLSAAHERGVLHRDLKPANIMIDGRGQVRITDFGLAGLAAEIPLSDLRSGTPAYMSAEQKAGKEVTTRSDIYSLGLVLHEMFTGKARKDTQSSPTDLVKDLDPAIERLILRCLEEDPKRRPQTALNVAMALPGADPIAAALAAGETPSPEMVAASTEKEGLSACTAWICFAGVLIALALVPFLGGRGRSLLVKAPPNIPPDGLAFRAQDILKQLGYSEAPRQTAYGFECCDVNYLRQLIVRNPANRNEILASHQPPVIRFWYRQHRQEIRPEVSFSPTPAITDTSPPNDEPGMIRVALDAKGRLVGLEVRPWAEPNQGTPVEPSALFAAAGLDTARFMPVPPNAIPPMTNDARMAWTGTYAEGRAEQIRLEAAFWQGRPVYFTTIGDWPGQEVSVEPPQTPAAVRAIAAALIIAMLAASAIVAWRNLRAGRGDRRGAARIAAITFLGVQSVRILMSLGVSWDLTALAEGLSFSLFFAGFVWCLYMAIEPHVRRLWPDALISWTRLLGGRIRNPLVASHVLTGIALNMAIAVSWWAAYGAVFGLRPPQAVLGLNSVAQSIGGILGFALLGVVYGIGFILVIVLLRLSLRRVWIADILGSILFAAILGTYGLNLAEVVATRAYFTLSGLAHLWILRRFGLLAVVVGYAAEFAIVSQPGVWGSWNTDRSLFALVAIAGVAAWAVWVIVSSQEQPQGEPIG